MSDSRSAGRPGFTLVEMLVVLAIIGILAALLLPAVMFAIVRAKTTAVAIELNQLASAIESYKQDKGDYPPNFRDRSVVERHIRKCYPKADPTYISGFLGAACGAEPGFVDEGESLVLWLAGTDNDPRYPFLAVYASSGRTANVKKYYDFDETRMKDPDGNGVYSYIAKNCQDTFYAYIDSRAYERPTRDVVRFQGETTFPSGFAVPMAAKCEDGNYVRPYWSNTQTIPFDSNKKLRDQRKPINSTSFQLICAGLDGEFGHDLSGDSDVKIFPDGDNYSEEDKDNITNFSNGGRMGDAIP